MKCSILLIGLVGFSLASSRVRKREICIVKSLDDPLADDAPAITDTLQKCGKLGSIVLPANQTFHIRSPLDLSACRACGFQINGVLSISPDWDYWEKQVAVITIPRTAAAVISSDGGTGVIDANNFGWGGDEGLADKIPKLFSISDASYQIHIRNLNIKNVPGAAFHVNSNSSAVRFYGVDFVNPPKTGYLVEQAQHVYIWNNTIRATESCVSILPNSSNIQVEDSICITSGTGTTQSGFELRFSTGTVLDWIRNVFVKSIEAIGSMNVVTFAAGSGDGGPHPVEIKNATFTDITISGPAKQAVYVDEGQNILNATDIVFRDFKGEVQKQSDLNCSTLGYICDFESAGWQVVVGS